MFARFVEHADVSAMDSGHHVAWFVSSFAAVFVAMRCYVHGSFTLDGLHESRYWHDEERIVNYLRTLARSGTEPAIEARSTGSTFARSDSSDCV